MLTSLLLSTLQQTPPIRVEVVRPVRDAVFDKGGKAKEWKQGGNPRLVDGHMVFDGAQDGNRQVDPQVAVGGGHVLHATNHGVVIYDKQGQYVRGVPNNEFNGGIDPKMYFDVNNKMFCFNIWKYWDEAKLKPVHVNVSKGADPTKGWVTYPVNVPQGVDGGAIGGSRKWIGYSFPGGPENTFVMKVSQMRAGAPANVYHFKGSLGHPVVNQDAEDDLFFVHLNDREIVINRVTAGDDGAPTLKSTVKAPHGFKHFGWPPASPMKGVTQRTASGDRNPKNLVLQNGCLWFAQTVNVGGRAGVQWHQFKLDGTVVQSGLIADPVNSFIQSSIAVSKVGDVLVGFQETGPEMFISARFAYRRASDPLGTLRPIVRMKEGVAATEGGAWGDYSSSCIDGDNLRDLWTAQSVANEQGRGSVVIGRLSSSAK